MSDNIHLSPFLNLTDFDDEDDDVQDIFQIPTQKLLFKRESDRFGTNISEHELEQQRLERIHKKTRQNNLFAMNVWRSWAENRNLNPQRLLEQYSVVPLDISATPEVELNFWLSRFVNEARRQDGSKYPPNTVYNIVTAIQRHLREECKRSNINFFARNDTNFVEFRSTLDAVMKSLTAEGLGVVRHTDNLCVDDEIKLWESGVINTSTAKGLSYGVFFYNCKVFGFRGLTEHKQVCADQYTLRYNHLANPVLIFQEHISKTAKGGLNQRKYTPKCITQYADPTNPRCVVGLFSKYLNLIPKTGSFYRRALATGQDGSIKFSSQVIEINTLGKYLLSMFDEAGIDRKVVNHSGRVYCCSTLYNSGFEEQEVMQRSGHKSTAVRNYRRPSKTKLQEISNALQPPAPKIQSCLKENVSPQIKSETSTT